MGIDLKLLPAVFLKDRSFAFSHMLLSFDRDYKLFDLIKEMSSEVLPCPLNCYVATMKDGETGYGEETEDKYSEKLRYILAEDLAALHNTINDFSANNRAIIAFAAHLPLNTPLVLYWC